MLNSHSSPDPVFYSSGIILPAALLRLFRRFLLSVKKVRTFPGFFSLIVKGLRDGDPGTEDSVLINGFLNGSERDFDTLVIRYKDMIFNLCMNITGDYDDAVDCSQEVFIKMYKNLNKFRFRSALSTWLYSIALNTCRNRIASAYSRKKVSIDGFENYHSDAGNSDPQSLFEKSEGERAVRRAISMLPEEERILIVMRDLDELSYEEITEITGVKTGTVKSRISRGRHRLRGLLQEVMP
jgi:RNA polymerase sigma-70 factor (ECF subfamily)